VSPGGGTRDPIRTWWRRRGCFKFFAVFFLCTSPNRPAGQGGRLSLFLSCLSRLPSLHKHALFFFFFFFFSILCVRAGFSSAVAFGARARLCAWVFEKFRAFPAGGGLKFWALLHNCIYSPVHTQTHRHIPKSDKDVFRIPFDTSSTLHPSCSVTQPQPQPQSWWHMAHFAKHHSFVSTALFTAFENRSFLPLFILFPVSLSPILPSHVRACVRALISISGTSLVLRSVF
jgi:hypothetical protein